MSFKLKLTNFLARGLGWWCDLPNKVKIKYAELRYGKDSDEVRRVILSCIHVSEEFWRACKASQALEDYLTLFRLPVEESVTFSAFSMRVTGKLEDETWYRRIEAILDNDDYGEQIYQLLRLTGEITDTKERYFISTPETITQLDTLRNMTYSAQKTKTTGNIPC